MSVGTRKTPRTDDGREILQTITEGCVQRHEIDEGLTARLLSVLMASHESHADLVRAICELATDSNQPVRQCGQRLLFSGVAETLGDSFSPAAVGVHDSVFSLVVEFCRMLPGGAHLDARLNQFGVPDRGALLGRRSTLTPTPPIPSETRRRIQKVFVLSRITLGADIAITSIALQLVQRAFPTAERYLVGPSGGGQLLTGLSGSRFVERSYEKSGLLPRLDAWHATSQLLQDMTAGLDDAEWLVVDPDSRLTQLGLLPIATRTVPYLFFESRSYAIPGLETLGELTAHWLQRALLLDSDEGMRPRLELATSETERAHEIVHAFRRAGASFVVAVNLGVGGNARKRIPGEFELDLMRRLLIDGSRVILDYGVGEEEMRMQTIVAALRNEGRRVCELGGAASDASSIANDCDVLTYRGPVAPFAALIGHSNLYVGYDSAFQHIAAAQGIAVIDIFVNSPNATFPRRWRPHSSAPVTVVETSAHVDDVTLDHISMAHRRLRQAAAL